MVWSLPSMSVDPIDKIAAKLNVLIEGIADHKMDAYSQEMLAKELVGDISEMCRGVRN